ncbi:calcium:proton antiporter [Methylocapsa palsarum]|uniref:Ca2+:H+ antiporter n=1 Tax=Methylocapsa palsarum TaxID=1612308 RepID=A0A1I3WS42_9HYPH|nr:calcium:proton antiporter [Methylocapsa palsarum]SFK10335.1 Ca2+:H+ antiporter [Methylocapsa palsarum]
MLKAGKTSGLWDSWRSDRILLVTLATCVIFSREGEEYYAKLANPLVLGLTFFWLFGVILVSSFAVVRHAEHIAERLGEPAGTLILTLSVTFIEVMSITAIMLHGENNPTLVRDTILSVIMIVLNGMVGLSLLLGGWKHREQVYNLQGANTYLGVIIPLVVLSVILPDYTETTPGPALSVLQQSALSFMSLGLYCAFLAMQTGRHRAYFTLDEGLMEKAHVAPAPGARSVPFHFVMLAAYVLPVIYLAEQLAHPIDYVIETLKAPDIFGGVAIALLVATPEAVGAVRAALANKLQRSVNILLGSVLSSIGLTVPVMLIVSRWTAHPVVLGVEHADMILLLLTLALSFITFSNGRTNVLQGAVHLIMFTTFLFLMMEG